MLEVGRIDRTNIVAAMGAPITCSTCGKPSFDDPDMKRIRFGKDKNAVSVCLCSDCASHLQGALSLMI